MYLYLFVLIDLTLSYSSSKRSLAVKTNSLDFFDFLFPRKAKPWYTLGISKLRIESTVGAKSTKLNS